MSSSNTDDKASNTDTVSGLLRAGQLLFTALKTGASPISAALSGGVVLSRFLAYTTLGRAAVLVVMLVGTFTYFKSHFTAIEKHKWEVQVAGKQQEIVGKVASVNAETKASQRTAQAEVGWWNKITAVVVDGIWKVQPPHPIESETIDLINETRGKADAHGRTPSTAPAHSAPSAPISGSVPITTPATHGKGH
jgi:hypothetical protein